MTSSDRTLPAADPLVRPVVGVGVVIVRATDRGPEVLLIRRGQAPRKDEWSIPGGRQEAGETVRETAVREVREETGLTIGNLHLIDVVDTFRRDADGAVAAHWTLIDFRADWLAGEPRAGDDAAEARWVAFSDLQDYGLWSETLRIIRYGAKLG